jgi:hypothetical protein
MSEAFALACTSTELIYLASLRGGSAIVGIADPLRGRAPHEVEAALLAARASLARRSYLAVEPDGTIALDYDVGRLVDVVARPRRTFFAYQVASALDAVETGTRRVFHVRGSLTVEIVADDAAARVEIVPLAGRGAIARAVLDFWMIDAQVAVEGEPAALPQAALRTAARLAASDGAAVAAELLQSEGIGPGAAGPLAATLARPRRNAALLAVEVHGPPGRTVGLGMLEGANGMWRLRPTARQGVAYIEVEPCSGPRLAGLIGSFVASFA